MKFLLTPIILSLSTVLLFAQDLSIRDSIDLYNAKTISRGEESIKLDAPNYDRALALSRMTQYKIGEYDAIIGLGTRNSTQGAFVEAIEYYLQAYSIAEALNDPNKKSICLGNIGIIHMRLENHNDALKYSKESLEIFIEQKDSSKIASVMTNIGGIFLSLEEGDSALIYLNEAVDIFNSMGNERGAIYGMNNMGYYHLENDQPHEALDIFGRILEMDYIEEDLRRKGGTLLNMGNSYLELKQFDKAESHLEEALEIFQKNNFRDKEFLAYSALSILYSTKNDFSKALSFNEKFHVLKDSILGAENQKRVSDLELKYDVVAKEKALLESQNKLNILEQEKRTAYFRNTIIIFSLISLLIMGSFFFYQLKQKRQLLAQENKVIMKNLEGFKEKLSEVEKELGTKNQDLTDFALDIQRKNEIAAKLVTGLSKIEKYLKHKPSQEFKTLQSLATSHHQVNEDISIFQENIETVNSDFFNSLKEEYPTLSKNELQLCGLLRLNLSTKDIATMRNVEAKSINMSRYRIRKKFGLKKSDNLSEFLLNFNT